MPILGDIPLIGWFFKNKQKIVTRTSLLVLISTRIIDPLSEKEIESFSNEHIAGYQNTISEMDDLYANRDPIYRMFFQDKANRAQKSAEGLIFERHEKEKEQEGFIMQEQIQLQKEQLANELIETLESVNKKPEIPESKPPADEDTLAHNHLIESIQKKQRSQLSLANFLHSKESHI